MARTSRRDQLLDAALATFTERGYEATSVGRLARQTGLSKAAFTYHFATKESLLDEIADPLVTALETVVERHPTFPAWPDEVRALLSDYLEALVEHADLVTWIDGDKAVLNHEVLGERLRVCNERARRALIGSRGSQRAHVQAAAVLGMLWRPMRNLDSTGVERAAEALLDLAVDAVETIRGRS